MTMPAAERRRALWRAAPCWIVLAISVGFFTRRTIFKGEMALWDFAHLYAGARLWLTGRNPYDGVQAVKLWKELRPPAFLPRDISWLPLLHPPTTLVVMAPFAMLPPGPAAIAWVASSLVLVVLMIVALTHLAGFDWADPRTPILAACVLAMATLHIGIVAGQPAVPTVALTILAIAHAQQRRDESAGALLGIALALKPQISGAFLLYCLFRRRWRMGARAIAVGGTVGVVALAGLEIGGSDWRGQWMNNIHGVSAGGHADYTEANPMRTHLVNLQMALHTIFPDRRIVGLLTLLIVGLLGMRYVVVLLRGRGARDELLELGVLAGLTLLPIYHRFYDATLLVLPLGWAFANLRRERARYARGSLLLLTPYLLPMAFFSTLERQNVLPALVTSAWWWKVLVIPYQPWTLLLITAWLLIALVDESTPVSALSDRVVSRRAASGTGHSHPLVQGTNQSVPDAAPRERKR